MRNEVILTVIIDNEDTEPFYDTRLAAMRYRANNGINVADISNECFTVCETDYPRIYEVTYSFDVNQTN